MEDRITPVLHLEMSDVPPEEVAAARAPELLARPEVQRVSWWDNERPGRDEFPRTVDEFTTLLVAEASEPFAAPPVSGGARSVQFRHTGRPGQGTYRGRPTLGLELVLISPRTPEGARALRDWADFVHIHYIAAAHVPGFSMITPYENTGAEGPRYLHFYELETEKAEEAFRTMVPETQRLIGPEDGELFREWFGHEQLVIDYVNTFRRVGARPERLGEGP